MKCHNDSLKKYYDASGTLLLHLHQGNSKGESVVAAILPSRVEASYCTSRFFCS